MPTTCRASSTYLRFVETCRDLIVIGPVGLGKMFMASVLGHIARRRRYTTLAGRCDQLLKRLRGFRLDGEPRHRNH